MDSLIEWSISRLWSCGVLVPNKMLRACRLIQLVVRLKFRVVIKRTVSQVKLRSVVNCC
jgi:hypothetical protein